MTDGNRRALWTWLVVGTVAQLAMIGAGHYSVAVRNMFGILGMVISLLAALFYARAAGVSRANGAIGGAIVGGGCAVLGIVPSVALGDTQPMILLVGTLSSAIIGAIAGAAASRGSKSVRSVPV